MSNCNTCVHKNERCFCPPGKRCTIYKAEKKIVEHTFKFKTDKNWIPGVGMCWTGCPFLCWLDWEKYVSSLTVANVHLKE
jgi:hypothetical protein